MSERKLTVLPIDTDAYCDPATGMCAAPAAQACSAAVTADGPAGADDPGGADSAASAATSPPPSHERR
jgi:hypothetical protein